MAGAAAIPPQRIAAVPAAFCIGFTRFFRPIPRASTHAASRLVVSACGEPLFGSESLLLAFAALAGSGAFPRLEAA
jgi:hypothetical protein